MYRYLNDKEFVHKMKQFGGKFMQLLCHYLNEDFDIGANFYLVGSGARNLITQNADEPVDLDYNLEIVRCKKIYDSHYLKERVRKSFNKCACKFNLRDCEDSTSAITSKQIFIIGNKTKFSMDICITKRDKEGNYHRLIHQKVGVSDKYYWNMTPNSRMLKEKADVIKDNGKWQLVRNQYLDIKNKYLKNHPSFVCYTEAVNNVYNTINQSKRLSYLNRGSYYVL